MSDRPLILFVVMPYEGEVHDGVTNKFYKNKVVKYMPLGVLSVAATVPDKYEVQVMDAASRGLSLDETIAEIDEIAPAILALSVVTYRAWSMVQILKRTNVAITVVGGPHATKHSSHILKQGAHAVFVDDAELTFPKWLRQGKLPGVYRGGQVNLNTVPLPARHLLDLEDYRIEPDPNLLFNVGSLRLPMYSSKGCPYKCIYCDVQQKTFNFKSPERVTVEFQHLIESGATSIHILDDAFNINKERVSAMSRSFVEAGFDVDWSARGTVEIREKVIADLAEAGCKRLHVGIESLDDSILSYFKKSCRFNHIEKFCRLCTKYGIDILGYFILGAPGETEDYRKRLPEMIADLGIRLPYFNILSPLAETPYYDMLLKSGEFEKDHWAEFCENPTRDFIMPDVRPAEERASLNRTVDEYIGFFKRKDAHVWVT